MREARVADQGQLVGKRHVEVLLGPGGEVRLGLRAGDAVALHVRVPVLVDPLPLRPVRMDEEVADDDRAAGLERGQDGAIVALLVVRGHVVKRERRDDRVTARQRILEPRMA